MTSSSPLISVCMPVYNAASYVTESIESILGQTFRDFEFLIIDDGSTDGSLGILEDFSGKDSRIRLISRPNRGVTATLNELVDLARGVMIARMDADDISLPERFERQVDYLNANPDCVAVGCAAQVIDPDGDPICIWFRETHHESLDAQNLEGTHGSSLCHPSVLMRRQHVLNVGKYSELYQKCEDLDLWLRLGEVGRLANLPDVLFKYRSHGKNVTSSLTTEETLHPFRATEAARRRRGLPQRSLPASIPSPVETPPANRHEVWGWQALLSGNLKTARKHAKKFLAEAPFSMKAWLLLHSALRGH